MRAALALVFVVATAAVAQAQPGVVVHLAPKKAEYLAAKAMARALTASRPQVSRRLPGKPPPPVINLYNTWTHEWLALDGDPRGELPDAETFDRFLRCHFTNQPTDMDGKLAGALRAAALHFGARRIDIVSGFRAPKYNLILRKKGHQVARDSQHTHGNAVDFRIPGVTTRALEAWARTLHLGGVGLYLESGFVHVDTGPVRYWNGT